MTSTQKPPTILQILPTLRSGGVERGTIEIAGAIAKQGWKSYVASAGGSMVPQVSYARSTHITLPLDSKNPFQIWKNAAKLQKIIETHGIDLIHARSRAPAWSGYLAARRAGIPFITTFHGVYGLKPFLKKIYNSVMIRGERVIAISEFISEHIQTHYALKRQNIRTIHRGVDLSVFDPSKISPQRLIHLMSEWRLPEDKPILFIPARFTRWKGQDVVVKALANLPHRNFYCVMAGDDLGHPNYRRELEKLIIELGLEGTILLTSSTPYMPEAYMLSDIVLCPSVEPEAFGRIPVEAQAMGRIVISTDHGGARETIQNGVTGFLVPPSNPEALAKKISAIMALSAEEKDAIREAAINHVTRFFTTAHMCEKTLKVYWELLESKFR